MKLLIALVAWVGAIAASVAISSAVANSIHTSSPSTVASGAGPTNVASGAGPTLTATTTSSPTPTAPAFDAASVKPTDQNSLFVGSNFSRVLAIAKHHLGARADIETTRVAPGDVELTTVAKNNQQTAVVINADGSYISTAAGQLNGSAQVYYLSQLGANTPPTLARRIAAGAHVPIAHLQYMLVQTDPSQNQFFWRVYSTKQGVYFEAGSANGPIQELGGTRTLVIR